MKRCLALLLLLSLPAQAAPPDLSGVPHLAVHYYDVEGKTARQVRAQINKRGPIDSYEGRRMDAVTEWKFQWTWPGRGTAKCDLSTARIDYQINMTLPRLVVNAETPGAVQLKWSIYLDALVQHELGHARYAAERAPDVLAAIRSATCLTADESAQRILNKITQHDIEYDDETDHGVMEGAHLP